MAFRYEVGDLIQAAKDGYLDVVGHGCNCMCTMKSGIAPLMAAAFPAAHDADQATQKGDVSKLGTFSSAKVDDLLVVNLYTQYTFTGRREGKMDLSYDALKESLDNLADFLLEDPLNAPWDIRIGLPKIGAGLAGGDWGKIAKIIRESLADFDVTIYVLKEKNIGGE